MSWEDQGRQEHGWFGHGTAPTKANGTADPPAAGELSNRIQAVAYGAIGALPSGVRAHAERQYKAGALADLTDAMANWTAGAKLGEAEFARRILGRDAADP